jgi:hypothetical protein
LALPFFAATLFVSAFLLFLVQPMIGKIILPRLGGTPQVWNTCMMFFQTALLVGYAYTHTLTSVLPTRRQLIVHSALLLLPLLILLPFGPFGYLRGFIPPPGRNPIFDTLWALTIAVGIPFLVVATSAPLLQRWFAYTGHPAAKDPYFLYGASNLGSMLALLAYPALVEPFFGLDNPTFDLGAQTWLWASGYILLVVMVYGCVFLVVKAPPSVQLAGADQAPEPPPVELPPAPPKAPVTQVKAAPRAASAIRKGSKQRGRQTQRPAFKPAAGAAAAAPPEPVAGPPRPYELTWWRRLRWMLLAAVPSSLMLGVTMYISTDISAIPLFWVIPLSLYLLSFILVFMRWPVLWTDVPHTVLIWLQPLFLLLLIYLQVSGSGFSPFWSILACLLAFFSTALVCHGELARQRPPTRYLTEFYLWMSIGGMLGGVFNGLLAPVLFVGLLELPLALVLAGLLRPRIRTEGGGWVDNLVTAAAPGFVQWLGNKGDDMARNFQGQEPAAAEAPAARPSRRDLPPRGWLLFYSLDVLLPVLLGVFFLLWLNLTRNWHEAIYDFWYTTMAMEKATAVRMYRITAQAIIYGIPLLICFLMCPRPLRFGLAVGAVLLASHIHTQARDRSTLYEDRSYFGILKVHENAVRYKKDNSIAQNYTYLMHGTTYHGLNFQTPDELRRTPTTYYHRFGPVGVVMEPLNWFPMERKGYNLDAKAARERKFNAYSADARLPVSVIGNVAAPLNGTLGTPLAVMPPIVSAWSEPAYATIGLGTGTMASYARPFHHMTFYEIDNHIRAFSEREFTWPDGRTGPFFNYIMDARKKRGAYIDIIMGDARQAMAQEDPKLTERFAKRDHYYRVMVVDAFSSDAIPVHLITEEAIKMYFEKLVLPKKRTKTVRLVWIPVEVPDPVRDEKTGKILREYWDGGVLCVHTSNRHVDLVQPVVDIAKKLGLKWRVGKDQGTEGRELPVELTNPDIGRFGSEYVMLAVNEESLPPATKRGQQPMLIWYTPPPAGNRIWTDNFSNLLGVFRW